MTRALARGMSVLFRKGITMDLFGANPVDVVVLVVIAVSALLALVRGFVAEILAIVAWICAIAVTVYGTNPVLPFVQGYMGAGLGAMATTAGGLFFCTLMVLSALSYAASRFMRSNHLSAVDRSLGFLFGMGRGALLVCLLYICVVFVFPLPRQGDKADPNTMQEVLLEAKLQPVLATGANFLKSLAPAGGLAVDDVAASPLAPLLPQNVKQEDEEREGRASEGEPDKNPDTTKERTSGFSLPMGYTVSAREGVATLIDRVGDGFMAEE